MKQSLKAALLLAACTFIISLVYNKIPIPNDGDILENVSVQSIELAGETIQVTIADSREEREIGLSGHQGLARDEGMLFIFPEDGTYAFWMKDMGFSIDIVWFSSGGFVVDTAQHVSPSSYPASFSPKEPARYVLELPEGWVEEYGVKVGDEIRFLRLI